MRKLIQLTPILFFVFALFSCEKGKSEEEGVCRAAARDAYYTGECFSDWDKETCEDYDDRQVNRTSWTWIPDGSCN